MKKGWKALSVILAVTMLFAGCGNKRTNTEQVTERTVDEKTVEEKTVDNKAEDKITAEDTIVSSQYYKIKHFQTGLYLGVKGEVAQNGVNVIAERNATAKGTLWRFVSVGDNCYQVYNKDSNTCLDVEYISMDNGAVIKQYDSNGGANQQVLLQKNTDDTYTFVFRHSNFAMAINNDYNAVQMPCDGTENQKFIIEPVKIMTKDDLLSSDGYKMLDEVTRERFTSYIFSTLSLGKLVYSQVEEELLTTNYYYLTPVEQAEVLKRCMKFVPYRGFANVTVYSEKNDIQYKFIDKKYYSSYNVWKNIDEPAWVYKVRVYDEYGNVQEIDVVSALEQSSVIEDSVKAFGRFPYGLRKFLNKIIYTPAKDESCYTDGKTFWIRMTSDLDADAIALYLAHEMGHVMDFNLNVGEKWTQVMEADMVPVTGYGSTQVEDMAEFSCLYHIIGFRNSRLEELKSVYPNRYALFVKLLYQADPVYYAEYANC